jgi:hypothetical protein
MSPSLLSVSASVSEPLNPINVEIVCNKKKILTGKAMYQKALSNGS